MQNQSSFIGLSGVNKSISIGEVCEKKFIGSNQASTLKTHLDVFYHFKTLTLPVYGMKSLVMKRFMEQED